MPWPFPGMNPWLEQASLWPDVHNGLIAALQETLAPLVDPRYYVAIEERVYRDEPPGLALVGQPDVALVGARGAAPRPSTSPRTRGGVVEVALPIAERQREAYLEVRSVPEGEVITVLELLSPSNKRPGEGRRLYLEKRRAVLSSLTHLVEIDLLRGGERMPVLGPPFDSDYSILLSHSWRRPGAQLSPFGVRDPIPVFGLPLRRGEDEPDVDLGALLAQRYERVRWGRRIDYGRPPEPPLRAADVAWAESVLREHAG